jgi:acetyl-CoA carboxylase biotin carboxyl carrier protein
MPEEENEKNQTEHLEPFGTQEIRELLSLLGHTDVTELLIERGTARLHIKRGGTAPYPAPHASPSPHQTHPHHPVAPPVWSASTLAPLGSSHHPHPPEQLHPHHEDEPQVEMPAGYTIPAPVVGIFYESPAPGEPSFVQEGDEIQVGDTVGIIEAMKIMNEIESEVAGRIVRILVKNGQPVEYGQPLMVVEPV